MAILIKNSRFAVRDLEERDYGQFRDMLLNPKVRVPISISAEIATERDMMFWFGDSIRQKSRPLEKRAYDSLVVELAQKGSGTIAFVEVIPQNKGNYTVTIYADPSGLTDYPIGRAIRSIADLLMSRRNAREVQTFLDKGETELISTIADNGFEAREILNEKLRYSIIY